VCLRRDTANVSTRRLHRHVRGGHLPSPARRVRDAPQDVRPRHRPLLRAPQGGRHALQHRRLPGRRVHRWGGGRRGWGLSQPRGAASVHRRAAFAQPSSKATNWPTPNPNSPTRQSDPPALPDPSQTPTPEPNPSNPDLCAGVTCPPASGECLLAGTCDPATGVCGPETPDGDYTPCSGGACYGGSCVGGSRSGDRSEKAWRAKPTLSG
jgi:hypothetical protein